MWRPNLTHLPYITHSKISNPQMEMKKRSEDSNKNNKENSQESGKMNEKREKSF